MTEQPSARRPDPDALLRRVQAAEAAERRGRMKLFLGAAPGVGKTYAMLEAARVKQRAGVDVVAGVVETHGRGETRALLEGIEVLPRRQVQWRESLLEEFDCDAARARRPELLLVDELAHSNAPGSRHAKRYQDVLELLDEGIDVYSTLNIQHVESLNDVVAEITGVTVRETVPDSIVARADEIELVDLPPEELMRRLEEGKVYAGSAGQRALQNFFRKGNLIALRELLLRKAAERVGSDMEAWRRDHEIQTIWPAAAKLLVCVSPSPFSERVIRTASRMAQSLRAEWQAVYVETPRSKGLPEAERTRAVQNLLLAERLGARTRVIEGARFAEALLDFARAHNVTMVVIGSPMRARWRELLKGSLVDNLMRRAGRIEVHVVTGASADAEPGTAGREPRALPRASSRDALPYVGALAIVGTASALAVLLRSHVADADLAMIYLAAIALAAFWLPRGPAIVAALAAVTAYDYFCVLPYFTLRVSDTRYLLTFGAMLAFGAMLTRVAERLIGHARAARARERVTSARYDLARDLAREDGVAGLLAVAARSIHVSLELDVTLYAPGASGALELVAAAGRALADEPERAVAQWALDHSQPAGAGTATLPGAAGLYLPLAGRDRVFGVLGVRLDDGSGFQHPESRDLLESCARIVADAVERLMLAADAEDARVRARTEQMRSSLLSSVSHDLRTPLAGIVGAASTLLERGAVIDDAVRIDLTRSILDEAARLGRLLQNLLEMTRIEGGGLRVRKDWQVPEEVIGSAIRRLGGRLSGHDLAVAVDPEVALAPFDEILIEQVLINLLENAAKYGPADGPIDVSARIEGTDIVFEVVDRGPGVAEEERDKVFEKFYRGRSRDGQGAGLGLTICKAVVEAHGGRIWVRSRTAGPGAVVGFALPLGGAKDRTAAASAVTARDRE